MTTQWQCSLVSVWLALASASQGIAQGCGQGDDSKIWYTNSAIGGNVEYPGFRQPGGTVAGDAIWKVFPSEWFLRTDRVDTVNAVRLTLQVINQGTPQAANWGTVEIRFARRDANGWLVPDMARTPPLFRRSPPISLALQDGYWSFDPTLGIRDVPGYGFDPFRELGVAIILYGNPGDSPTTPSIALPTRSAGERYRNAPQPSFSGVIDGRTGQMSLLVPPLIPEASEVRFALGFIWPKVQPSASSATDSQDPREEYLGVGAYYNDLASRGGRLRLYVENDNARNTVGLTCVYGIPLYSPGRGSGVFRLPGGACSISIDPNDPLSWLPMHWGWATRYLVRDPYTLSADGYFFTPWLDIPQSSSLIGHRLHFQVLTAIFCSGAPPSVGSPSNSLEIVLR